MVFEKHEKENKCKLVILTGFFGSGKTTLIQYLIKNSQVKIGIIENDLAEINIDGKILSLSDSMIQVISNACICCSGSKHISESIDMLLSTHDNLEYIFIETTGLANPMKLKKALFGANVKHGLDFIGTVCIVDAKHTLERQNIEEQVLQIAYSDFILISKKDLVSSETSQKVKELVQNINPSAKIDEVYNGKYNLTELSQFLQAGPEQNLETNYCDNNLTQLHITIKTYSFTCELVNPSTIVQDILNFIVQNKVYRCKGIMKFPGSKDLYVFHGVHHELDLTQEVVSDDVFKNTKCSFVFIGEINKEQANELFSRIRTGYDLVVAPNI